MMYEFVTTEVILKVVAGDSARFWGSAMRVTSQQNDEVDFNECKNSGKRPGEDVSCSEYELQGDGKHSSCLVLSRMKEILG